ncbi:MAG: hypothetical protein ACRERU_08000 [Methylococcales bacterium]
MAESPSFSFGTYYEITISAYCGAALSMPAIGLGLSMQPKDLFAAGEISTDGKYTLEQHLTHLQASGNLELDSPLLVFGARNLCVNWRSPAVLNGKVYALEGEEPLRSQRPYYGIGLRNRRLACNTLLGGGSEPADWDFFCAGVPVLWDGWEGGRLLDLMLCEASDHSHLFDLPRGKHPAATDATHQAWQDLHTVFIEQLYVSQAEATAAMRNAIERFVKPLGRSEDYFHSIIGVCDDGGLVYLAAQGRLEHLGQIIQGHGCRRAVCMENSGSVMPTFLPDGAEGEAIPLVRAPNFRPRGRAVIVVKLDNGEFKSQSLLAFPIR